MEKKKNVIDSMAQEVETPRKKVVFLDCDKEHSFALLTEDQLNLLIFLQKNYLLEDYVTWEVVADEAWEKV